MNKETLRNSVLKTAIAPISGAGDDTAIVSSIIDTQGFESLEFEILTGILADSNATFAVTLAESNDPAMGTPNAVAENDMVSQVPGTAALTAASFAFGDDGEVRRLGYIGSKRYVQLTITPTGNTGAWPIAVAAKLGNARWNPPTQPAS